MFALSMKQYRAHSVLALCSVLCSSIEALNEDALVVPEFADSNALVQSDGMAGRQTFLSRFRQAKAMEMQAQAMEMQAIAVPSNQQEQSMAKSRLLSPRDGRGEVPSTALKSRLIALTIAEKSLRRQLRSPRGSAAQDAHDKLGVAAPSDQVSDSDHEAFQSAASITTFQQSEKEYWDAQNRSYTKLLIGVGCYMAPVILFAILYKECMKRDTKDPLIIVKEPQDVLFEYSLFDTRECCDRDRQLCFCAWCCTWIRWADTASNDKVHFLEFYPAVFIVAFLNALSILTYGGSYIILLLVVVSCRWKIRKAFNLDSGSYRVCFQDCIVWMCCPWCAAAQEARQADYIEEPPQTPMFATRVVAKV